jgi:hypothetical protein
MVVPMLTRKLEWLRIAISVYPQSQLIRSVALQIENALTHANTRLKDGTKSSTSAREEARDADIRAAKPKGLPRKRKCTAPSLSR